MASAAEARAEAGVGVRALVFRVLGGFEDGFQRQCGLLCVSVFLALREEEKIACTVCQGAGRDSRLSNLEKAPSDLKRGHLGRREGPRRP